VAVCALLAGHVFLMVSGAVTTYLRRHSSANAAQVEALQNKIDFAANLDGVVEREMKPFSMLALANSVRPKTVYFERASASAWNVLRVEGQASRADQVEGYIENLQKTPGVKSVRSVRQSSRAGRATFDFEIVFDKLGDVTTGEAAK
jgi:hypothetical protein